MPIFTFKEWITDHFMHLCNPVHINSSKTVGKFRLYAHTAHTSI